MAKHIQTQDLGSSPPPPMFFFPLGSSRDLPLRRPQAEVWSVLRAALTTRPEQSMGGKCQPWGMLLSSLRLPGEIMIHTHQFHSTRGAN